MGIPPSKHLVLELVAAMDTRPGTPDSNQSPAQPPGSRQPRSATNIMFYNKFYFIFHQTILIKTFKRPEKSKVQTLFRKVCSYEDPPEKESRGWIVGGGGKKSSITNLYSSNVLNMLDIKYF